ncbi:MAG: UMP kinase [Lachnospiraceae bacterium]|nr:UMP kinase [Lachnospiraceae bacterium]
MDKKRRVMLKLSGEALAGDKHSGFDLATVQAVAGEVKEAWDQGVEIAVVIGGGNFWRGRTGNEIARVKSDQIGMLATVMNALYVSEVFRSAGMKTAVFGAFEIPGMMPIFDKDEVEKAFAERCVVFFAGGTGHPYFSTDTGTALRAVEIEADVILLAKAVDGVYNADPKVDPEAKRYDRISISEVVAKGLKVIDLTASVLCMENHLPLAVFSLNRPGNIADALNGHIDGTIVTAD